MITLKFQYKLLFKLQLQHPFFSEDIDGTFHLLPTRSTVRLMDKMGLLIRQKEDVWHFLYDDARKEVLQQQLRQLSSCESKLSFFLVTKNPYFANVTDIPVDRAEMMFYFSNNKGGKEHKALLHQDKYVSGNDLVGYTPSLLNYTQGKGGNYKLLFDNGAKQAELPVLDIQDGMQIDTSRLFEGFYKVLGNDKEVSSFLHFSERIKNVPLAFVDLFFNHEVKRAILSGLENDNLAPFDYGIVFNARSVYWKYLIIPRGQKRIKSLSVECTKKKVDFKSNGEQSVFNTKAYAFTSTEPIAFRKSYDFDIQLKEQGEGEGAGKKTLLKKMAFAPIDLIRPCEQGQYLSEIRVYL